MWAVHLHPAWARQALARVRDQRGEQRETGAGGEEASRNVFTVEDQAGESFCFDAGNRAACAAWNAALCSAAHAQLRQEAWCHEAAQTRQGGGARLHEELAAHKRHAAKRAAAASETARRKIAALQAQASAASQPCGLRTIQS